MIKGVSKPVKYLATVVTLVGVTISISGCTPNEISGVKPLTLEEVAGKRLAQLSNDEKEGLIYKYVSDRIMVDASKLISIDEKDASKITGLIDNIDNKLKGANNDSIKDEYANYLLMEFSRTPFEWSRKEVKDVGFDPASRLYFVDVTYSTNGAYKKVVPNSKIPIGSPDEEVLKKKRYSDYISYLTNKSKGGSDTQASLNSFVSAWGSIDEIMNEQQGASLLARTQKENQSSGGIGKLAYSGMIQDSKFNTGADITFRYILKYRYNLGEETDLKVESLYLKDYKLKNSDSVLAGVTSENANGTEVLKPFIDRLLVSYHKAVSESDSKGLYNLFYDYSSLDKYYDDLNKYTYNFIGGYNFKVLQRNGTDVVIEVNRINQIRAKGAEMSLPSYDEKLVYNLVLDSDDRIRIKSVNLVSSKLTGEPFSIIKDVSGVSDLIQYSGESFTADNKSKVENTLKKFSNVVFNANVDSTDFTNTVDIGVSQTVLQKMSDVIQAIPNANRKVNYIVSWDTKTNVYARVTMREIFETDQGNYDTESVIELANRDGIWKVVNYTRTMNIKTSSAQSDDKGALSIDKK